MYRTSGSGRNFSYNSMVPRGPASAYAIYLQDHYRRLRKHFFPRTRDQRRIMNYCYSVWKAEPENIKARYAEYAKFDKERALRDRREWLKLVQAGEAPYVPARRHKPRPPGFPRPTRNGFMFFAAEIRPTIRAANPSIMACEVMKAIAVKWHALDIETKRRYLTMSEADKNRFLQQKQRFREAERNRKRLQHLEKTRQRLNRLFNQRVPKATPSDPEAIDRDI